MVSLLKNENDQKYIIREIFKNSKKDLEALKVFPKEYRHKIFDLL